MDQDPKWLMIAIGVAIYFLGTKLVSQTWLWWSYRRRYNFPKDFYRHIPVPGYARSGAFVTVPAALLVLWLAARSGDQSSRETKNAAIVLGVALLLSPIIARAFGSVLGDAFAGGAGTRHPRVERLHRSMAAWSEKIDSSPALDLVGLHERFWRAAVGLQIVQTDVQMKLDDRLGLLDQIQRDLDDVQQQSNDVVLNKRVPRAVQGFSETNQGWRDFAQKQVQQGTATIAPAVLIEPSVGGLGQVADSSGSDASPKPKACSRCGGPVEEHYRFCGTCGMPTPWYQPASAQPRATNVPTGRT